MFKLLVKKKKKVEPNCLGVYIPYSTNLLVLGRRYFFLEQLLLLRLNEYYLA